MHFKKTITRIVAVALFVPLVGMAAEIPGNSGGREAVLEKESMSQKITIPVGFLERKPRALDISTRISVSEVLNSNAQGQEMVLVDVRNEQDFIAISIPGSLNMPLHLIKTKEYLKNKILVLVNQGYAYSRLEQERERLVKAGFPETYILDGGLNAWRQAGGPLSGNSFAARNFSSVSPSTFFQERHYENRVVVCVGPMIDPMDRRFIPEAVAVSSAVHSSQFLEEVRKIVSQKKNLTHPSILIVSQDGQYRGAQQQLKSAGLTNVFFLQGGLNAYKEFLMNQASMRQPGSLLHKVGKCPTCP